MLLATATAVAPPRAEDTVSEGAQWEARPSQADFERLGPPAAVAGRVSGRATLDCALTAAGRLRDCQVKNETPAGAGFGEAAVRLSPLYRLERTQEVELEGSRLTFVVRFRYAETPMPASTTANVAIPGAPAATPVAASALPEAIAAISSPTGPLASVAAVPGWQADFLDVDRTTRDGQFIQTYRVTVYAAGRADRPSGAYEVARLRLDCPARTQAVLGVRVFDRAGNAVGWREGGPAAPVEADSADDVFLETTCNATGARPGGVTLAEALAGA